MSILGKYGDLQSSTEESMQQLGESCSSKETQRDIQELAKAVGIDFEDSWTRVKFERETPEEKIEIIKKKREEVLRGAVVDVLERLQNAMETMDEKQRNLITESPERDDQLRKIRQLIAEEEEEEKLKNTYTETRGVLSRIWYHGFSKWFVTLLCPQSEGAKRKKQSMKEADEMKVDQMTNLITEHIELAMDPHIKVTLGRESTRKLFLSGDTPGSGNSRGRESPSTRRFSNNFLVDGGGDTVATTTPVIPLSRIVSDDAV